MCVVNILKMEMTMWLLVVFTSFNLIEHQDTRLQEAETSLLQVINNKFLRKRVIHICTGQRNSGNQRRRTSSD